MTEPATEPDGDLAVPHRGRAVLVTGATRGIGRAIAETLLAAGATVGVGSRDRTRAIEAAATLGEGAIAAVYDPEAPEGARRMVEDFAEQAGHIDGLVNNAGISIIEPAERMTRETFREVLDGNVTATFLCAQAAAAAMAGGGTILNVSSISAYRGTPGRAAYATAKAAVDALTRVLAVEWAPAIRVVGIAPGHIETEQLHQHIDAGTVELARMQARTPLGRIGALREVSAVVSFLLGPGASFVTGDTIAVDGGWLAFGAA